MRNRAMVNGDTVADGDVLAVGPSRVPVKVVRISQDSVVFSSKGRTFTKRLNQ
ncbi:MAG: hypothetical protein HY748_03485 [Elusimicrobia bacterium]|nr:hypothetical protein [Elusimicrobiota bacterium]